MRTFRIAILALLAVIGLGRDGSAQSLTFSLLERYLDSLREQAGIPGLTAAVLQDRTVVWERGFGRRDVDANLPALPDTPYFIGDVSQTFGATVLLKNCVDESYLETSDVVRRWVPEYPEPLTTVEQLLSHTAPSGQFVYNPERFAALTAVIDECGHKPYKQLLAEDVFDRLGMNRSVPGRALALPTEADRGIFPPETLARYAAVLGGLAQPYRVEQGRPIRTQVPVSPLSAASGIVTTVRDFALFDAALRDRILLSTATLQRAWTQTRSGGTPLPTGLGWFVQNYNGEPLVWHLGLAKDAYSSLVMTLPSRNVTMILMANSDALGAQAALDSGDITSSIFARLFLRLFVG